MRSKFLCFLFLICFFSAKGQNSQWQQFGIEQGLPQSNITCITQDNIGYLWLGTYGNGLVRFDGKHYKVFNQKNSLPSGFVNDLLFQNDSLFIATQQGLSLLTKGSITSYQAPNTLRIKKLNNRIYLATDSGIYEWKKEYLLPLKIDYKIDLQTVNDIEFDGKLFWIATKMGLWSTKSLSKSESLKKVDPRNFTSLLHKKGDLFVAKFGSGIYQVEKEKLLLKKEINDISKIDFLDNDFYILTKNQGIKKFSKDWLEKPRFNKGEIRSKTIQDIFLDDTKNLWLATKNNGIFKHTQNNFQHFTRKNGLKGNQILAISSQKQQLWLSTSMGGIQVIKNDSVFNLENDNVSNTTINSFAFDSTNQLWLGTNSKGLLMLKQDSVLPVRVTSISNQISSIGQHIKTVTINQNHIIWVADGNFLHQLITNNGIITKHRNFGKSQGLRDTNIKTLVSDNNKVWYATNSGNLGFIENNQIKDFYQILGTKISINCIYIRDDFVFLGTSGKGVWIASKTNPKEVFRLEGTKELNSQNIRQLLFDKEGNLWVGTEKGLNKVILKSNTIQDVFYYTKNDGFLGVETAPNSITQSENGSIWFGTNNGLTKLLGQSGTVRQKSPRIFLESLQVNFKNSDSLLNSENSIIQFKPNQNNISFQYKTVDLNQPNSIEYSWKLNNDFSPWTTDTSIDFANLAYGSYEFLVKSRNRDLIESDSIQLQFTIQRPWYLKDVFFISVIALLLLISGAIIHFYLKRIKKVSQQKIEKLKLQNQLLNLEQKALQLQMNPHFIFNVLNGIKAMGTLGKIQKMNESINEFATLLRGILENSREEFVSLHKELDVVKNYILLEKKLAANSFEFDINLSLKGLDPEEILIPPMLLQPFIENSIKHGFKGTNKKGFILISLALKKYHIDCEIKDNGVGFKTSQMNKKSEHKSAALEITKNRLKGIKRNPEFSIKEIQENNKIKGTLVSFHIPYKTDF